MSSELQRAQRHIEEALNELHAHPDHDGVLADARALLTKASVNIRTWRAAHQAAGVAH